LSVKIIEFAQEKMIMRTAGLCALLSIVMVAGCATSKTESYALAGYDFNKAKQIAVVEVKGVYGEGTKGKFMDMFNMELLKRGYAPVDRARVQTLLKEQQFQNSGVTSNENAAKAGKLLNIPVVMVVNVPKYSGDKMDLTATMVEVETSQIIWMGSGSGSTGRGLATVGGAVLGAAAGAVLAGGSTGDRVIGGIAGGAVGGIAGYALSPEQEEQVRKVVAKICEDLPSLLPPMVQKK
jgi:hypothetical protein